MSIETITKILYIWLGISLAFPFIFAWMSYRSRRLKRELLKQDSAAKHYEEMLYAAKDGYLTFSVFKNKTYQYCSRRLATLLNLKNGEDSTTDEIFNLFNKEDADQLTLMFNTLKNKALPFELIAKTKSGQTYVISGVRISSADNEINSNCLWFRDITSMTDFIDKITNEALNCREQLEEYRLLIDNLPTPIWMRDKNNRILLLNKQYLNLLGLKNFKDINMKNSVLHDLGNTTDFLNMALLARESNTPQKKQVNILTHGDLRRYEITETPYYDSELKKSYSIGSLIDITEFDEAKRNYRVHLEQHLDILSSLDTAFCIINTKHNFTFGNAAFLKLWNLPDNFLDSSPHYNLFLDTIREKKILPEVSDFKAYKEEENKAFDALTEQHEDLLYIPDGRTFRRLRAPHPDGTIIAYEDISDTLDAARKLSDMVANQQSILDNITDSVLIFSSSLKLRFYNLSFLNLWSLKATDLDTSPTLSEILNMQKQRLPEMEDWNAFLKDMQQHLTSCTPFSLKLKNKHTIKVTPVILADTSLMITYHKE